MKIFTFSNFGYETPLVSVECNIKRGLPIVDILGLSDYLVKDTAVTIRNAFGNSGFEFPKSRVLIDLSPADLKKDGNWFDLPIATAIYFKNEEEQTGKVTDETWFVAGELTKGGTVLPVTGITGILAALRTAKAAGIKYAIVPKDNYAEAVTLNSEGMKVFFVDNFTEVPNCMQSDAEPATKEFTDDVEIVNGIEFPMQTSDITAELKNVPATQEVMDSVIIAMAGKHNMIITGATGCGKSLLVSKLEAIQPLLTETEAHPVQRIHSLAGLLRADSPLSRIAPFRMPHQTASIEGICGGGPNCRPGEISLAHKGILWLDEAAEFRSSVLQILRVPLESKSITLSRAGRSTVYPADFQLIMTTNPCPCGNYGTTDKVCLDSARSIKQYWLKFSAPLLNRVEVKIFMDYQNEPTHHETIQSIREKVANAYTMQRKRGSYNGKLTPSEILTVCSLQATDEARNEISSIGDVSQRTVSNIWKMARTVADIELREQITVEDVRKAIKVSGFSSDFFKTVIF